MIGDKALKDFRAALRGTVLTAEDPGYDETRRVFNKTIDRRPALIARCADAADVVQCVLFARAEGLELSVRGGGHSVAGKAVCDAGVMVDLSTMTGIRVDIAKRTARAQPGLRLGQFDRETQALGLATTMGIISDTGIAGLTLGGGIGWLNGKHGLACDNVLSVQIVCADGELRSASAHENADLFWAVRGGGGNFGIVTEFEYRLHTQGVMTSGLLVYPLSKAKAVLRFFHEFAAACPDELSMAAVLLTGSNGEPALAIVPAYCGPLAAAEKLLKPLRTIESPAVDTIAPMPYVDVQSMLDASFPQGMHHYWKSSFLRQLGDGAVDILLEHVKSKPSPQTAIGLQQMHGAAARVAAADTAFPHRHSQYDFLILSMWSDPVEAERNVAWTRQLHHAMEPLLESDVYVNNLGDEGSDRVRAAYGANYARLAETKMKYDPTNFFRINQNIAPVRASASR